MKFALIGFAFAGGVLWMCIAAAWCFRRYEYWEDCRTAPCAMRGAE